jgi:hypothetical protein
MRNYNVVSGEFPAAPEEQDAYIVTGSPAGVYDPFSWIGDLKQFLREAKGKSKLVGICFGHQIMAEAFGGRVEKSERGWGAGLHRYDVREPAGWMDPVDSFAVPVSHQDQIVEQPPNSPDPRRQRVHAIRGARLCGPAGNLIPMPSGVRYWICSRSDRAPPSETAGSGRRDRIAPTAE